jgi:acetolactate synthase-1/2/3 large subunit
VLESEGVEIIFGYPGATIAPLNDKLSKSNIKHILSDMSSTPATKPAATPRIKKRPRESA